MPGPLRTACNKTDYIDTNSVQMCLSTRHLYRTDDPDVHFKAFDLTPILTARKWVRSFWLLLLGIRNSIRNSTRNSLCAVSCDARTRKLGLPCTQDDAGVEACLSHLGLTDELYTKTTEYLHCVLQVMHCDYCLKQKSVCTITPMAAHNTQHIETLKQDGEFTLLTHYLHSVDYVRKALNCKLDGLVATPEQKGRLGNHSLVQDDVYTYSVTAQRFPMPIA